MIRDLQALGYDDPSRKYLVWMDATVYCGIAQIYPDDRPIQDNDNNGRYPMYARVDAGCNECWAAKLQDGWIILPRQNDGHSNRLLA